MAVWLPFGLWALIRTAGIEASHPVPALLPLTHTFVPHPVDG